MSQFTALSTLDRPLIELVFLQFGAVFGYVSLFPALETCHLELVVLVTLLASVSFLPTNFALTHSIPLSHKFVFLAVLGEVSSLIASPTNRLFESLSSVATLLGDVPVLLAVVAQRVLSAVFSHVAFFAAVVAELLICKWTVASVVTTFSAIVA